jgi:signal peptidase II
MHAMQDEAGAPLIAAHDETTPPDPSPEQHSEQQTAQTGQPPAQRSRLFAVLGATAAVVLVLDQLTKLWALRSLTPGDPVDVIGSLIRLNLIRNPGAAFSIGTGATWVLTLIAFGVLVFILVTARRLGSLAWAWALGLLLGGSLGNLADRLFREPGPGRGHVVDFIDYFGWFIGNVADIAIVGAAGVIAVLATIGIGVDGQRPEHGRHEAGHEHGRHERGRRDSGQQDEQTGGAA